MKREIYVTTSFVGFHAWPDAPEEVAFLRNPHRHIFLVRIAFPVSHDDRVLEFFIVKREINRMLRCLFTFNDNGEAELGAMSCEMIAERLIEEMMSLGYEPSWCVVIEDGENGAIVTRD